MLASTVSLGSAIVQRVGIGLTRLRDSKDALTRARLIESLILDDSAIFLDTSPLYSSGRSEVFAGDLKRAFGEKVFLATKYYPRDGLTQVDVIQSVHASLKNMGLESIDLLQIHWPNPLCDLSEVLAGFKTLRADGVVRNFGLSNFSNVEIDEITRQQGVEFISCQMEFNLSVIMPKITEFNGIVPIIYGALLQGRLSPSKAVGAKVEKLAGSIGVSSPAVVLGYVLNRFSSSLCVVKVSNHEHLSRLQDGARVEFSEEQITQLDELLPTEPLYVDSEKIQLRGDGVRAPYMTLEDALRNQLDLVPCPFSLAARIRRYGIVLPLKVFKSDDRFLIEDYDPFDQIKKFWAWKLAHPGRKVPVLVIEAEDL